MSEENLVSLVSASGKQCSHIIPHLYGKRPLRLVVNSCIVGENERPLPQGRSHKSRYHESRRRPSRCQRASAVLHIGPSLHVHEAEIGYSMVDAATEEAKNGSLKHFVFNSVIQTQLRNFSTMTASAMWRNT